GEDPIEGVDAEALAVGLRLRGHRSAQTIASQSDLAATLSQEIAPGDIIVCLGAGDITKWAATLPSAISSIRGS
ncbi:MAG: UDP-N-acetylmuramate--L-alanine ligase, partial [Pseudomonadota bacterium]